MRFYGTKSTLFPKIDFRGVAWGISWQGQKQLAWRERLSRVTAGFLG